MGGLGTTLVDFGTIWVPILGHFAYPAGIVKASKKRTCVVNVHTLAPSGRVSFSSFFLGGVCLHVFLVFGALLAPLWSPRVRQSIKKGAKGGPKRPPKLIQIGNIFLLGPRGRPLVAQGFLFRGFGVPFFCDFGRTFYFLSTSNACPLQTK